MIAHVEERMATKGRAPLEADEDEIQAELRAMVKDFAAEGIEASLEMGDVMAGEPERLTPSPTSPRDRKRT